MKNLGQLNYHHLRHFYSIAKLGNMTEAAHSLHVSQSTLSIQLRDLEDSLGAKLFSRDGRRLRLTEKGRVAFEHAEQIFDAGDELLRWFGTNDSQVAKKIRIGALTPLSKNLQFEAMRSMVMKGEQQVSVIVGELDDLKEKLKRHEIDLLFSNVSIDQQKEVGLNSYLLGRMPVYLVGRQPFKVQEKTFPKWLNEVPLFLPSRRTSARIAFEAFLASHHIEPKIAAEVDDTALLRLLALSGGGLALVPEIGVRFEIAAKRLLRIKKIPGIYEHFYAITATRKHLPSAVNELIQTAEKALARRKTPAFT